MFALVKSGELFVKAILGFKGDRDDVRGLSLTTSVQNKFGPCVVAVVPGGFDEETTDVDVAGLGDGATLLFVTGGAFSGDKAEVGHKAAGMGETADVVDLTQESQSS